MTNYENLINNLRTFRKEMDWEKYHNPKDLSLAVSIESGELLENFLWKTKDDEINIDEVKSEMADIYIYLQYLADSLDVDLLECVEDKLEYNKIRFKDGWKVKK